MNDNPDLLPDWFRMSPQYNTANLQQELGEYITALKVEWSDGRVNYIGENGAAGRGERVQLEQGEHVVRCYQLFWGPRKVFVPLEVVDFVFVTNHGRQFGPFTRQVGQLYCNLHY